MDSQRLTYVCKKLHQLVLQRIQRRQNPLCLLIDLIQPALIITDKSQFDKISGEAGDRVGVLCVEDVFDGAPASDEDMECIRARLAMQIDTDPSCVINTSGSTGVPGKGSP